MDLLVLSCSRGYKWRVSTHPTPGTKGDAKQKHGRESMTDRVTVQITIAEHNRLVELADKEKPQIWQNPLLPPFSGHIEDLDVPIETAKQGVFLSTFTVVQAYESTAQSITQPGVPSPAASQKKANKIYDDFLTDLDGLADIPTDASGSSFSATAATMGDAFEDIDLTFDSITDPLGDGTWRDLSRTLDTFASTADLFIDAAREIEDSIGAVSADLQSAPIRIRSIVADAVDNLKAPAGTVASFLTQAPSDLFSMMQDAGLDITEDAIRVLMEDNGIEDPLFIAAGSVIAIPVAV